MKPRAAKTHFLERSEMAEQSLYSLTPRAGVEAMLAYFAEERADGCPLEEDGDMVLFQWGTHDWGDGRAFEISIVRQLIVGDEEEPRQLDLRFRFAPAAGVSAGEGNQWCESPNRLAEFRQFVSETPALKAVGDLTPESVELRFGRT
jgi:hypothetical protein